jgi:hypothetical protein
MKLHVVGIDLGKTVFHRLVLPYGPPLLAFALSLYLVRKRKPPLLSDPVPRSDSASQ